MRPSPRAFRQPRRRTAAATMPHRTVSVLVQKKLSCRAVFFARPMRGSFGLLQIIRISGFSALLYKATASDNPTSSSVFRFFIARLFWALEVSRPQ